MKRTSYLVALVGVLVWGVAAPRTRAELKLPARAAHIGAAAWSIQFDSDWRVVGGLPEKAMVISLQGLANRLAPQLYIMQAPDYQWEIPGPLYEFYQRRYQVRFTEIKTGAAVLELFKGHAKGYVVWDPQVSSSLNVAFTIAGLEDAVVVTADLIPLVEKAGLKQIDDLRGRYTGQADVQIYQDAYDRYWARCNHDAVMLMGGQMGAVMVPAMADIGVAQRMFFEALAANPKYPEETALERRILAGVNRYGYVFGWHPYSKDTEEQHVTLTSTYGLKMEGLYNLPNLSFNCLFTVTPGFKYANRHSVARDAQLTPGPKVYISFVQSDQMGLSAWTSPDRGKMPFAWQVPMDWSLFSPAALQYFYESATPNDYLIGGLSAPSYMYPKHIPADRFAPLMQEAGAMMQLLDLPVLEILDNSAADGNVGNADLPKDIVDRYYEAFPDVIGFVNGYGPAHTRDLRDSRPMISYDYYIDPNRPRDAVAADMNELIALNPRRPYFLLVHVRETNSVASLVAMITQLRGPVEIVPLDVFLKLAASAKTYQTCFEYPDEVKHFSGFGK
jgi:hypothetical protein